MISRKIISLAGKFHVIFQYPFSSRLQKNENDDEQKFEAITTTYILAI